MAPMKSLPAASTAQRPSRAMLDVLGQFRLSYDDLGTLAILSDVSAIVVASVLSFSVYHLATFGHIEHLGQHFAVGIVLALLTAVLMQFKGLYSLDNVLSFGSRIRSILMIWSGAVFFLLGTSFALKISEALSRASVLMLVVAAPILLLGQRLV